MEFSRVDFLKAMEGVEEGDVELQDQSKRAKLGTLMAVKTVLLEGFLDAAEGAARHESNNAEKHADYLNALGNIGSALAKLHDVPTLRIK